MNIRIPGDRILHYPSHSGLRVTSEIPSYAAQLYELPGPLIVFERDGREFAGYTWEPWNPRINHTKPKITVEGGEWNVEFPAEAQYRAYPVESSLDAAVAHYRAEHTDRAPAGRKTLERLRRSITFDMWLIDGRIANTYADAIKLMEELDRHGVAEGTLLYIAGWHGPYDLRMPAWAPADELGGRAGFKRMADTARKLGVTLMPHFNYWGYSRDSNLFENYEEVWSGHAWPGGMRALGRIEYMMVNDTRWAKLFDSYFDATVGEFGLDAVFMDQCGNAFDSRKGDMVQATTDMLERIHSKFPDLLIGAEVLSEHIMPHCGLIQACWLMEVNLGKFSPITRMMFGDRIRFVPHLFLVSALPARYVCTYTNLVIEQGNEKVFQLYMQNNHDMGALPSVRIDYSKNGLDPVSLAVLKEG